MLGERSDQRGLWEADRLLELPEDGEERQRIVAAAELLGQLLSFLFERYRCPISASTFPIIQSLLSRTGEATGIVKATLV